MSVCIQVDENHAIVSDPYCWKFAHRKRRKNKQTGEIEDGWEGIRFYGSLEALVKREIDEALRASDARTLTDLLEVQNTALSHFARALSLIDLRIEVVNQKETIQ